MIDTQYIADYLTSHALYKEGHGAGPGYLGSGMLYYAITYMFRARLCICLGLGGGFVPRCMRQAQRDLNLGDARTILVDNLSGVWGDSIVDDLDEFFRVQFPEIQLWRMSTETAALECATLKLRPDYIHIDADHSRVREDWQLYRSLCDVFTLHDTAIVCSVPELVNDLRQDDEWDVVDFKEIGTGLTLVKRRMI